MNEPRSAIGDRLKKIRKDRNISLEEASNLTGVSKPMLGQIERGKSIPTITTLWKIATGLKTPLSSFLEEQKPEYSIVNMNKETPILEENGAMRAYPLFAYDPLRNVELFYIEFDAGCNHTSDQHNDGVEEYVLVLKGTLQLVLGDQKITLEEKQGIRFMANITHSYRNPFPMDCAVYDMIFYR